MAGINDRQATADRGARMLRTALGPVLSTLLQDPAVVEVMLNPDGRIWVDWLSEGLADTGEGLSAADGERIIRLVAHHVGAEVHAGAPRVSAELPESGSKACCRPWSPHPPSPSANPPSRSSRSTTTWPPAS